MQPLCFIAFTLLCSLSFLSSVLSIHCNNTQYAWPMDASKFCCDKCPPGKFMVRRPDDSCAIQCESCEENHYTDSYNLEMRCTVCKSCNNPQMEYKSPCNASHNAVCRCKAGYKCKDEHCKQCVVDTTTTTTILTTITTATTTTTTTPPISTTNTVWFLVIIGLLCIGITFVIVAKIKPFLRWMKVKLSYCLDEKPALAPLSSDEEVSKPIQEVCGKCDQPIDV